MSHSSSFKGRPVYLNVYDLIEGNDFLYGVGLGILHSGVVVDEREYSYGDEGGVFVTHPQDVEGVRYRETITIGTTFLSPAQVKDVVRNLKVTYRGDNYHMLEQSSFVIELMYSNCNHFSNDLCKIIAGKEIPSYVNRCAKVASWFSGIVNAVADHMAVVTPSGGGDVQETSSKEQLSSPEGGNDSTFSRITPV
ncbi:hypothetical protein WA171_002273 [Blastocystis sp. BT1]